MDKETMPEDTMYGSMELIGCLFTIPFVVAVIVCVWLACTT